MRWKQAVGLALSTLLCIGTLLAEGKTDAAKRPLSHDDYDSWRMIRNQRISPDGNWVLYRETPGEGDADLVVRNVDSGQEHRRPAGYAPPRRSRGFGAAPRSSTEAFSPDSKFAIFLIHPSFEEQEKAKKKKGKDKASPTKSLGIMRLSDGSVEVVERVQSFQLPEDAGAWVAYLKEEPLPDKSAEKTGRGAGEEKSEEAAESPESEEKKKKKDKNFGTEMVLRRLADGSETSFGSVLEYRFTKNADWLLYTVSNKDDPGQDGLYARSPGSQRSRALLSGEGNYKRWTLDEEETHLAFLSDRDTYSSETPTFRLYGWDLESEKAEEWVSGDEEGFPAGMAVSDKEAVSWSHDGAMLLFGVKEPQSGDEDEPDAEENGDEPKFDLWHWNDPFPQPQQKRMAAQVRNETFETVFHVESGRIVRLADEELPDVSFAPRGPVVFAMTDIPYRKLVSWDATYYDAYLIDPLTGKRTQAASKIPRPSVSPSGRYVTWFEEGDWHVFDGEDGRTRNLTQGLKESFSLEDWDTPSAPRPYGSVGWTEGEDAFLVYDRFDIWELKPDGSPPRMITEGFGRRNRQSLRRIKLDPEEDLVPSAQTLLLQATDADDLSTGFLHDQVEGAAEPRKLVTAETSLGQPVKAKNADRLLFDRQSFDVYPDLFVASLDLSNAKRVTDLGAQTDSFLWGKAELRDFFSADGKPLKGILIKPENFDPSRKYPLMVYIYETLHPRFHRFSHPQPGTSINFSYYASNDYVLWMPDIEYGTGYPGEDALKCVLPGVQMLVREGFIDEDAIGIQGHSWGGYQIAYMVTQTDIFAAAEAGAPVSNMTSAYGGIRWSTGRVRQFQYERTQSRLGDTLWKVPLRYINNSPLFFADRIQTPLLILHNDEDGAVPWYQGIELIMALRRLGREGYMFNYNGEEHGLRQRINQRHFTERMAEFFDHYLKGAPRPDWMEKGIPAWEK